MEERGAGNTAVMHCSAWLLPARGKENCERAALSDAQAQALVRSMSSAWLHWLRCKIASMRCSVHGVRSCTCSERWEESSLKAGTAPAAEERLSADCR
jgi:hypothetical protein